MRAYLERLRVGERAEGTWMKRANTLLAERLEAMGSRVLRTAYVAPELIPEPEWIPPPIPEPLEPPQFEPPKRGGWVQA